MMGGGNGGDDGHADSAAGDSLTFDVGTSEWVDEVVDLVGGKVAAGVVDDEFR